MTRLSTVALIALFSVVLATAAAAQESIVRVYVSTPSAAGEFVDKASKMRAETVATLVDRLKSKKKKIAVIDSLEAADVAVELTSVEIVDGAIRTTPDIYGVKSEAQKVYRGVATLRVGDYTTEFTQQRMFTALVAAFLADDVEKWVKDNRDQIMARRKP